MTDPSRRRHRILQLSILARSRTTFDRLARHFATTVCVCNLSEGFSRDAHRLMKWLHCSSLILKGCTFTKTNRLLEALTDRRVAWISWFITLSSSERYDPSRRLQRFLRPPQALTCLEARCYRRRSPRQLRPECYDAPHSSPSRKKQPALRP